MRKAGKEDRIRFAHHLPLSLSCFPIFLMHKFTSPLRRIRQVKNAGI
jgi:hypothetical protein